MTLTDTIADSDELVALRYRAILMDAWDRMLAAGVMQTEYPVRGYDLEHVMSMLIDMAPTLADIRAIPKAAAERAREIEVLLGRAA